MSTETKKAPSVRLNFIMNIILTLSSFIFPLITFPYVSRILQPIGTGKVEFATSIITYFSMFAVLGVPTYGIRACAQVRDDKEELSRTVQEILIINMVMTVLVYIAYFFAIQSVPKLHSDSMLFYVMGVNILFTTLGVEWLYKGLEQYSYITIRSIIFKFLALIAMFLFVKSKGDYIIYGFISIFAAVGGNLLNFLHMRHYVTLKPVGNYNFKRHFKVIIIFFALSVATTIYTNLDKVMLGFMTSDADVGYYGAAVKIKNVLLGVVTSLSTVLLPRASYYIEKGLMDEFKNVTKKALNFVWLIAAPLTVYFIIYAKESVLLLSGKAYMGAVVPMQIIMPTILFIGFTNVLGIQIMVPLGREKQVVYSTIVGAVVDLVINAIAIPHFASSGAAAGTLIAEAAVLLVQMWYLRKDMTGEMKELPYGKVLLGMAVGTVACIWIKTLALPVFFALALSAILFFGFYYVVLILMKEALVLDLTKEILGKVMSKINRK